MAVESLTQQPKKTCQMICRGPMGLVETIFFRQIGGAKDTFLQSHPYHISDDDIAKNDESFLLSFLMLRFSFLYSQAQYDAWPDLNKSQMARPKSHPQHQRYLVSLTVR